MTTHKEPSVLSWMVTDSCNADCYHCYRSIENERKVHSIDYVGLASLLKGTSIKNVNLTGGEPLLVQSIDEIISSFHLVDITPNLATNALLLTKSRTARLKDAGLYGICTTVHSSDHRIHDRLVGYVGALELTLSGIDWCLRSQMSVSVNIPLSLINAPTVVDTIHLLDKKGVGRIKILRMTPLGRASKLGFNHISDSDWLSLENQLSEIVLENALLKIQTIPTPLSKDGGCYIHDFQYLNIDPFGDVYPCCLLTNIRGKQIGNLSKLLSLGWDQSINSFYQNLLKKYDLTQNPIPCLTQYSKSNHCPLYSRIPEPKDGAFPL